MDAALARRLFPLVQGALCVEWQSYKLYPSFGKHGFSRRHTTAIFFLEFRVSGARASGHANQLNAGLDDIVRAGVAGFERRINPATLQALEPKMVTAALRCGEGAFFSAHDP